MYINVYLVNMSYFFLLLAKPTIAEGNDNVTVVLPEGGDYSMTCTGHGVPAPKMIDLIILFTYT